MRDAMLMLNATALTAARKRPDARNTTTGLSGMKKMNTNHSRVSAARGSLRERRS